MIKVLRTKPILLTGLVSFALAIVFCFIAMIIYMSPDSYMKREVTKINVYMNNEDYEAAHTESELLQHEMYMADTDVLEALMQLSYENRNRHDLENYCSVWLKAGAFPEKHLKMQSVIKTMEQQEDYITLVSLLNDNNQTDALGLVNGLIDKYPNEEELTNLGKGLYIYLAEVEWRQQEYDKALDLVFEAEKKNPGDDEIRSEILKIAESAVSEYMYTQRYEKAFSVVWQCYNCFGRDVLEDYRADIAAVKACDIQIQKSLTNLTEAIKNDDDEKIVSIIGDSDFVNSVSKIRDHIYEDDLIKEDAADGTGIAVYNAENRGYVYYGDFKNGKRNGDAVWLFLNDAGELKKYRLSFSDDIPEGNGEYTGKEVLTIYDEKGKAVGKHTLTISENFTVHQGVIDGKCTVTAAVSGNECSFVCEKEYYDGYQKEKDESDYPEGLAEHMSHSMPVGGWIESELYDDYWKENYKTTIWYSISPKRRIIEGFSVLPGEAVASGGEFKTLSENRIERYSEGNGFYATSNPKKRPVPVINTTAGNATPSYIPDVLNPIDRSVYPTAAGVLDSVGWDLKAAYYWSVNTLSYYGHGKPDMPEDGSPGTRWFADFGFSKHKGNCFVFAATFCEMARLLGYPCRQMYGQVPAARGGLTPHSWTEVDINGRTYVFDPEFQHATKKNGFMIGYGTPGTWMYTQYSPMSD